MSAILEQFSNWRGPAGRSTAVCGGIVLLCDLAQPIAPFASIVFIASIFLMILLGIAGLFLKSHLSIRRAGFLFFAILFVVSGAALSLQPLLGGEDRGVVAAVAPPARLVQDQIADITASLRGIEDNTRETADNTRQTAENTERIQEDTAQIADNTAASKRETSANPRKELANRGVTWDYQSFLQAIRYGDEETALLFIEGGMKLQEREFPIFLEQNFNTVISDAIVARKAIASPMVCVKKYGYRLYPAIEADKKKREAVHALCNDPEAIKAAKAELAREEAFYNERVAENSKRGYKSCVADLKRIYNVETFYARASRFNILDHDTIRTPEDYAFSKANIFLLTMPGGTTDAEGVELYNEWINEGCDKFGRPQEISTQGVDAWRAAVRIFTGKSR